MFIKRDLRKIDEILGDESASKAVLKFSNRKAEFDGNVRVLCRESKLEQLSEVHAINLYGNDIHSLQGIGLLAQTPVEELNLGCNKLASLPLEVSYF